MFAKIWAIARKDLQLFFADKRSMLITFLVPIGIASFFALIFGGMGGGAKPASKIKVAVADLDGSALTKKIIDKLEKSDSIEPILLTETDARSKVTKGELSVGVAFPKGFGDEAPRAAFFGEPTKVSLFYDPSKGTDRQVVLGALMQTAMSEVMSSSFEADRSEQLFNDAIASESDPARKSAFQNMRDSMSEMRQSGIFPSGDGSGAGPGMREPYKVVEEPLTASKDPDAERKASVGHIFGGMAVQGVLFFGIEAAMSILRDRRTGLWNRLRAAPVTTGSIVAGRGIGSWIIALLIMAGIYLFGIVVLGVRVEGSWLGFALTLAATALMTACFGLFVASLGKTESQARGFSILAVLMMSMLGGAWFPTWLMPSWVQSISLAVPVRWAVDGFDAVTWRGQGVSAAMMPVLGLLGFSLVFAGIAVTRMRKL